MTLLGYEVIEAPNDLNFSRSFLFTFSAPLTHVGALLTYRPRRGSRSPPAPWSAGTSPKDNNSTMSYTGQFAFTPIKDLTANFNWITGPEQTHINAIRGRCSTCRSPTRASRSSRSG